MCSRVAEAHLQQLLQRQQTLVVLVNNRQSANELANRRSSVFIRMFICHDTVLAVFDLSTSAQDVAALAQIFLKRSV